MDLGLADRMKYYEEAAPPRRCLPFLPVLARVDGRAFHTFTQGLDKPFDAHFSELMAATMTWLVEQTGALIAYTQSDEITLLWYAPDYKSDVFFQGRIPKLTSIVASLATVKFNRLIPKMLPAKAGQLPVFDCRVWQVPNRAEAANTFLWREMDATRNSIQGLGQAHLGHELMQGSTNDEVQEMLWQQVGINWNDYPDRFKRGMWCRRVLKEMPYEASFTSCLPPKHAAHADPDLKVTRPVTWVGTLPRFSTVTNKVEFLFEGAEPQVAANTP